jgi:hypothetical protein
MYFISGVGQEEILVLDWRLEDRRRGLNDLMRIRRFVQDGEAIVGNNSISRPLVSEIAGAHGSPEFFLVSDTFILIPVWLV